MRRFLRVRILFVLIALLLVPALALPFAERIRDEWARFWEPKAKPTEPAAAMFVDGYGSATPLLGSDEGVRDVRIDDQEFILLQRLLEALPTDSGTAEDYAKAVAGSEASSSASEERP